MRAGISNERARKVVRLEVGRLRVAAESELQNGHAGEAEALANGFDRGRDDAEILGHDGQVAELRCDGLEKLDAGAGRPAAVDGGGFAAGHVPEGLESAEMVDADDVEQSKNGANALDPPAVAVALHLVPTVNRIAPQLAAGAEVIGWHAGLPRRRAVRVEMPEAARPPDVGTA